MQLFHQTKEQTFSKRIKTHSSVLNRLNLALGYTQTCLDVDELSMIRCFLHLRNFSKFQRTM